MAAWNSSDKGLAELRKRWESSPGSHLFLQLAEEYRRRGEFGEAVEVLQRGILTNPSLAAEVALGRSLLEGGDPLAAQQHLQNAVQRDPTQMVAYRHLVEALIQLNDGTEAARCLEVYRQLNARDPDLKALSDRIERLLAAGPAIGVDAGPTAKATAPLVSEALDLAGEWQSEASLEENVPSLPGVMILPTDYRPGGFGTAFLGDDEDETLFVLEPTSAQSFDLFSLPCRPLSWNAPTLRNSPRSGSVLPPVELGATATLGQLYLEQGHFAEAERIYRAVDGAEPSGQEPAKGLTTGHGTAVLSAAPEIDKTLDPPLPRPAPVQSPGLASLTDFISASSLQTGATKVARRRLFLGAYLHRITRAKRHVS